MSTEIAPGTYTVKFTGPRLSGKRFNDALALVKGADGKYDSATKTWTVTVRPPVVHTQRCGSCVNGVPKGTYDTAEDGSCKRCGGTLAVTWANLPAGRDQLETLRPRLRRHHRAGLMVRTRDEAKVAAARRLYALGLGTRAVAAQVGADPRTVSRWLAGVVRPRGPRPRPDVQDAVILDLKDREGLSFEEIGRRVHMSKTGARMRYYALTGRPRPERAKNADTTQTAGEQQQ